MVPRKNIRLRARMMELGCTQQLIADVIGKPYTTVNRKMAGETPFKWSEIIAICKLLNIENPIGWFE